MKRAGKFYITQELIESNITEIEEVFSLLRFVPFRVEFLYPNRFEYIGTSHLFREIEQGEVPPEYILIIIKSEDNKITLKVEELKK